MWRDFTQSTLRIDPTNGSVTPQEAIAIQREWSRRVIRSGNVNPLRFVAGADVAYTSDQRECIAGAVLWDAKSTSIVEQHVLRSPVRFPYIPGLLSFREAPAILEALRQLTIKPDVLILDGQGWAHPRRFGLACHVGVILDLPTIGCAKSVLVGEYENPGPLRSSRRPLVYKGRTVGVALRTRDGVKPVFVSAGHKVSLQAAVKITLACCTRYRLPEPTRLADKLVARKRAEIAAV